MSLAPDQAQRMGIAVHSSRYEEACEAIEAIATKRARERFIPDGGHRPALSEEAAAAASKIASDSSFGAIHSWEKKDLTLVFSKAYQNQWQFLINQQRLF